MPNQNYTTPNQQELQEDEIDLRELFATIGRYKWSIFFTTIIITAIVVVFAYRMPKYYKTTTVIEVKPKAGEGGGFSLGGAGALLGLAGISGGGGNSINKDTALMSTYRVNKKVIENTSYYAQFYTYEKYRYIELSENNCSISVTYSFIGDYKKYGMEIKFEKSTKNTFKLYSKSYVFDEFLGEFSYDTIVHTDDFDIKIHKKDSGVFPNKILLNHDKHYIFDEIISRNLSTKADKKNPFVTISYLDTLPIRGEQYIKTLIDNHISLCIGFEIEDADITLKSLNSQIEDIEEKVQKATRTLEDYKSNNKIISPSIQVGTILKGKAETENKIILNKYQLGLIKQLITFVKKNKNIDAIAPTLVEFRDQPTTSLISKLQALQLQASNLAQEFKPAYPKLKSIKIQIRIIKKKIYSNLINLEKTLKAREKGLKKLEEEYNTKLTSIPTKEKEMKSIMTDYTLNEKLYAYLLQKRSTTELKKAEAMSRFRTIEPIYTNPAPAKPKKALIAIVGFITAFILSIFLAFFRGFLHGGKER